MSVRVADDFGRTNDDHWVQEPPCDSPDCDELEPEMPTPKALTQVIDHAGDADDRTAFDMRVAQEVQRLQIRDRAQQVHAATKSGPVKPFDCGTVDEVLQRTPAPPPRVDGLIPADAGTLIVAQKKTGKTTFELNIARSLITGTDLLDRFPVTPIAGNVALLNYEVSGHQIATWASEHEIPGDRLILVNLRGRRNPLGNDADRTRLAALLTAFDVETLITDPFGRAFTGTNQNDPGEVGAWLADLDQFAREDVGARDIILAAHAGWNGERTRGSSALDDWGDSIITLTRDKDDERQRYLRAEGRDIQVDEDRLEFNPTTRNLTLTGTGSRRANTKHRQLEALLPHVEALLAEQGECTGNRLDTLLREIPGTNLAITKGDGAKAARLLINQDRAESRPGKQNATLFRLKSSPSSPNLPEGKSESSPTSLYTRGNSQGNSQTTTSPNPCLQCHNHPGPAGTGPSGLCHTCETTP